jgi:hypothetical protein
VISVASQGAAGSVPATTPAAATPTGSAAKKSGKGPSSASLPAGVGQTPSKPAPPAVLQNLRTGGSGQSYEQKSKSLPNVVSTG